MNGGFALKSSFSSFQSKAKSSSACESLSSKERLRGRLFPTASSILFRIPTPSSALARLRICRSLFKLWFPRRALHKEEVGWCKDQPLSGKGRKRRIFSYGSDANACECIKVSPLSFDLRALSSSVTNALLLVFCPLPMVSTVDSLLPQHSLIGGVGKGHSITGKDVDAIHYASWSISPSLQPGSFDESPISESPEMQVSHWFKENQKWVGSFIDSYSFESSGSIALLGIDLS
ncbi:hypothetical protein GOBAR_AA31651 [Gossypium barbadense]|uniref:Uncharacterized protein n=1 Tax=Gossypium barbadense TaxID=3634 RepID=A0A2P5WD82_GOSBA|nr:hypothetical protein GOBAR_AA31651 [Gossypium barbadense]